MCGRRQAQPVRRAPVSGCLRTRAVGSGSKWTRIRARPCPPVGSAPFACRAWTVRTAATFTGTTSRLAAACRRVMPRRAPCVPRISGTTTWRIGPSVGVTRPSPATRLVRRGRVSKTLIARDAGASWGASGITGSAFSPGDLEPARRSYRRHRHRRLPVAGPQRGQRCPSDGQHLRVLHRRHGRCGRGDGPDDAQIASGQVGHRPNHDDPIDGAGHVVAPEQRVVPALHHSRSIKDSCAYYVHHRRRARPTDRGTAARNGSRRVHDVDL